MASPVPKGDSAVIAAMNTSLGLTMYAIACYQAQHSHLKRWGYGGLSKEISHLGCHVRKAAKRLLKRLEFYGAEPDYTIEKPTWPRDDVKALLKADYDMENGLCDAQQEGIKASVAADDEGSARVFRHINKRTNKAVADLSKWLRNIEDIGPDGFLEFMMES